MVRVAAAAAAIAAFGACGCRSIRATYVGQPAHGEDVGGLPIVVMQPRYLKVTYKTVTYRVGRGEAAVEQECREIATEAIETGEVYALDVDRPAAGSTDYAVELAKDRYYPAKVGAKIQDETLEQTAGILESLAARLGTRERAGAAEVADTGRVPIRESVERIEVYDLRDLATPLVVYR
jgi:hypothetical protein